MQVNQDGSTATPAQATAPGSTATPARATAPGSTAHPSPAPSRRLAGAPISWGACEVPGWGEMPERERVLTEMRELGLLGTELGAPGFLPAQADQLAAELTRHQLQLVGAFAPLVLHDEDGETTLRQAAETLELLQRLGADVLVVAAVADADWATPQPLDDAAWRRLAARAAAVEALAAERGIAFALHPHVGTVIETDAQVQRALAESTVGWCLDSGHLMIGGTSPSRFAREHGERVTHVHLKDVDGALAARLREGSLSLMQATQQGLFVPLGDGVAEVGATLEELDRHGYTGWFVLEQDTAISPGPAADGAGPLRAARRSLAFLNSGASGGRR